MVSIGIRFGAVLSVLVVVLGTLGNVAAFRWVPEVPLLVITAVTRLPCARRLAGVLSERLEA